MVVIHHMPGYDPETMYAWTAPETSEAWDLLAEGPATEGYRYFVTCGIAAADGSSFTGDAFSGELAPSGAAPDGGSQA